MLDQMLGNYNVALMWQKSPKLFQDIRYKMEIYEMEMSMVKLDTSFSNPI